MQARILFSSRNVSFANLFLNQSRCLVQLLLRVEPHVTYGIFAAVTTGQFHRLERSGEVTAGLSLSRNNLPEE